MGWNVEFVDTAKRQLRKLDRQWQSAVLDFLEELMSANADPRNRGKALVGDKRGLWRYRVGDYRIICDIQDDILLILVLAVGHRREVYN
ncbi:MAG: type II toxin-antitoxin system RelE/ParE family toxin [Syntrophobacteraceae bacterium]